MAPSGANITYPYDPAVIVIDYYATVVGAMPCANVLIYLFLFFRKCAEMVMEFN